MELNHVTSDSITRAKVMSPNKISGHRAWGTFLDGGRTVGACPLPCALLPFAGSNSYPFALIKS